MPAEILHRLTVNRECEDLDHQPHPNIELHLAATKTNQDNLLKSATSLSGSFSIENIPVFIVEPSDWISQRQYLWPVKLAKSDQWTLQNGNYVSVAPHIVINARFYKRTVTCFNQMKEIVVLMLILVWYEKSLAWGCPNQGIQTKLTSSQHWFSVVVSIDLAIIKLTAYY